eukprot:NODE_397_length_1702_cov_181.529341_g316_i0.p1 GENE.NODE_397_length_1702_cov_181.529341_g316_i0~~NODE_397_length_1702_cov_181.529341_g316_i0.p1  ORF type:complete len:414 (+),score=108.64 NODE_397_length_1702_cov_181.529341_g316_i0:283-1524(+)
MGHFLSVYFFFANSKFQKPISFIMESLSRVYHSKGVLPQPVGSAVKATPVTHFPLTLVNTWPKHYKPQVPHSSGYVREEVVQFDDDDMAIYRHDSVLPMANMEDAPVTPTASSDGLVSPMIVATNSRERLLWEEFARLDLTKDGVLHGTDLTAWAKRVAWLRFGKTVPKKEVQKIYTEILGQFDRDQSGSVTFDDFVARFHDDPTLRHDRDEEFEQFVKSCVGKPGASRVQKVSELLSVGSVWLGHVTFMYTQLHLKLEILAEVRPTVLKGRLVAGKTEVDAMIYIHTNGTVTLVQDGGFMEGFVYVDSRTMSGLVDGRVEEPFTLTRESHGGQDAAEMDAKRKDALEVLKNGLDGLKDAAIEAGLTYDEILSAIHTHMGSDVVHHSLGTAPEEVPPVVAKEGGEPKEECCVQ